MARLNFRRASAAAFQNALARPRVDASRKGCFEWAFAHSGPAVLLRAARRSAAIGLCNNYGHGAAASRCPGVLSVLALREMPDMADKRAIVLAGAA